MGGTDPYAQMLSNKALGAANKASAAGDILGQQATQTAGQIGTDFNQFAPKLNANFQQFDPKLQTSFGSNKLDAFSNNLIARSAQDSSNKLATGQRDIMQRFGNSPVSSILQSQASMQSGLNNNQIPFLAALSQRQREGAEMGAVNQARLAQSQASASLQGQGNQTALAQQQASSQAQQLQNDALAQKLNINALPVQIQGNLAALWNELQKTSNAS